MKRSYIERVIEKNTPLYGITCKKGGSRWNIVLSYQDLNTCSVNHHIELVNIEVDDSRR